jgi:hypothetical protein
MLAGAGSKASALSKRYWLNNPAAQLDGMARRQSTDFRCPFIAKKGPGGLHEPAGSLRYLPRQEENGGLLPSPRDNVKR